MNRKLLSIVISSYNDCEIIQPFYQAIVKTLEGQSAFDWELIYVDDGSSDGSVNTLNALAASDQRVSAIALTRNFGQQKAFLAGIKHARGHIIITLDGDFQYQPECLIDLAHKVSEGYDIVSGIRARRKDSLFTRLTSRVGQGLISQIFHVPVTDFGSVKGFSRFITDQIIQHENYCTNIYGLAYALTNRLAEIPVTHLKRYAGKSKWNFRKRLHMYLDMYLAYSPYESTGMLKAGFISACIGFLYLSFLLYIYYFHGIFAFRTFGAGAALGLMAIGLGLVLGSISFSFLLRIYRQLLWKGHCYIERNVSSSQSDDVKIRLVGQSGKDV